MNKDFNTRTYIFLLASFAVSIVALSLSVWVSTRVHPPKPVIISCDRGIKEELERAGEQLENLSKKTVQYK